ncbi:cation channel sperm-associated protein 4 isoform X2 [Equus caballus]|uniref:cation channel sperm-associated protein 4 isoform X2 n=1 Tax=Equus caballus TaxID=9796 RepID=UPI000C9E14E2|nr:cation channel sperm-associated protein 4 isoform X2 [Equus caballus]
MTENQKIWWQYWTDITNIKPLNVMRVPHEPYVRPEEQVLINRRDITPTKDAWDMQEFITRMYIKQLLRHPAFQLLLATLLLVNAITIALRTNSFLGQKHYELFSTIDDIVLTILICELFLGWLNGFWIFWKDGWNILNFIIIFILLVGFFINKLSVIAITYTLRSSLCLGSLSLVLSCLCISRTCRLPCTPSSSASPRMAGWTSTITFNEETEAQRAREVMGPLPAISRMETREYAMEIGGAIYFAIFITIGAFIGVNLLVVVVTTNLEQMMKAGEVGQQHQVTFSKTGDEEKDGNNELPLVHCVVARLEMSGLPQEPLMGGPLPNLSENTCDNFCLVLEAIQENLMQYKEIREELNTIVDEVRSIRFNQEQEEELLQKHLSLSPSMDSGSSLDIREVTFQQDLITALVTREKVQESNTNVLLNKHKASR